MDVHAPKGVKRSDGHPLTAEDVRFWWEDLILNESLSSGSRTSGRWTPPQTSSVLGQTLRDFTDTEVYVMCCVNGEIHCQGRHADEIFNCAMHKEGEANGRYGVRVWRRSEPSLLEYWMSGSSSCPASACMARNLVGSRSRTASGAYTRASRTTAAPRTMRPSSTTPHSTGTIRPATRFGAAPNAGGGSVLPVPFRRQGTARCFTEDAHEVR